MKMMRLSYLLSVTVVGYFISAMVVFASSGGVEHGNGGGVYYCPKKEIFNQYTVYDFFAVTNPIYQTIPLEFLKYDGHTNKKKYIENALIKIKEVSPSFFLEVESVLKVYNDLIENQKNLINLSKKNLNLILDANSFYLEKDCSYLQLVNWIDGEDLLKFELNKEIVLRDELLYRKLDPLQQAASDLHEVLYKIYRENVLYKKNDAIKLNGSFYVQKLVGQIFSLEPLSLVSINKIRPSVVFNQKKIGNNLFVEDQVEVYLNKFCDINQKENLRVSYLNYANNDLDLQLVFMKKENSELATDMEFKYITLHSGSSFEYSHPSLLLNVLNFDFKTNTYFVKINVQACDESFVFPATFIEEHFFSLKIKN